MTKIDLINKLKTHASKASIFGGRFICVSSDENNWVYHRPAVDATEPSIDLSNEGFVMLSQNTGFGDNTIKEISYEEFIAKYNLTKE